MISKGRSDQISGGVFLIGLAVLFMTGAWWPGILFVIGASTIARGVAEGQSWYNVPGGVWMIGLGLLFWFGFRWELILILVGLSMLFGYSWFNHREADEDFSEKPKRKNDDKSKNDDNIVDTI
ncbi:MAG: hypothetical protein K8L99_19965 [Anaerolineae bacterium]|nr:hypothetical protein [Anaerolineae bacterium]